MTFSLVGPGQSHHHHLSCGLLQLPHNCSPCFHFCPLNSILIRTTRGSLLQYVISPPQWLFLSVKTSTLTVSLQAPVFLIPGISLWSPPLFPFLSHFHPSWMADWFFFPPRCFLASKSLMVHFLPIFRSHPKSKLI